MSARVGGQPRHAKDQPAKATYIPEDTEDRKKSAMGGIDPSGPAQLSEKARGKRREMPTGQTNMATASTARAADKPSQSDEKRLTRSSRARVQEKRVDKEPSDEEDRERHLHSFREFTTTQKTGGSADGPSGISYSWCQSLSCLRQRRCSSLSTRRLLSLGSRPLLSPLPYNPPSRRQSSACSTHQS